MLRRVTGSFTVAATVKLANGMCRPSGRLLTCEHLTRRVTRTEYNGKITVLADKFNGKPLNAERHRLQTDGSICSPIPRLASVVTGRRQGFAGTSAFGLSHSRPTAS